MYNQNPTIEGLDKSIDEQRQGEALVLNENEGGKTVSYTHLTLPTKA